MTENTYLIIDFDSTFIKVEALDELANICLQGLKNKSNLIAQIKSITEEAMNGDLKFDEALDKRVAILSPSKDHIAKTTNKLKSKVSDSFKRNKTFFQKYADKIFIVSGGFTEIIAEVVKDYGIKEANIFANSFVFNNKGLATSVDKSKLLSKDKGKVKQIKSLNLKGKVYVLGDGYTDYEIKEAGLADKFFAYIENIKRDKVVELADSVLPSFDEFLFKNNLPMQISYPKSMIKVLLLENIHRDAADLFKREGYEVKTMTKALSEKELCKAIKDVSVLGIRSKTKLTKKVIQAANKLIAVGAFCVGTNQIDLAEATKAGVAVFNAPYANTRSVVELAIAHIISLSRNLPKSNREMHDGLWNKSAQGSVEVRAKKLGIVGYGNIGSQLSVLAELLGMEVYYYDVVEKLSLGNSKKCFSLPELLKKVDIVSLHVDGNPNNKNLISEKEFSIMKNGAILINLSRGFVVDIKALVRNLKSGKVKAAAIDVFPHEPESNEEEFSSELRGIDSVALTPHVGGSTEEAQSNIADFVPSQIVSYINSGKSFTSVNFPEIQLPELEGAHRFIHVHHNVPGIMAQINNIFATHNINILGQYLKTNEVIGYVITDVAKKYDRKVVDDLKKINDTIKFRVLY